MTQLVLGATGMLGRALMREATGRGLHVAGAARSGTDYDLDIADDDALTALLERLHPRVIVNAAGLADVAACERAPDQAWRLNARAVAIIASWARSADARLVQVSTDHYFTGHGAALHDEAAPVRLVNEYARTKYAGEAFALTSPGALVLRTNIAGFRRHGSPTFAEWAIDAIRTDAPITLFDDFVTSTIDVGSFSVALFDLVEQCAAGLLNLAAHEAASKKVFVEALAARLDRSLSRAKAGSVTTLTPRRAESLALDVRRAEALLGRALPGVGHVADALIDEWKACDTTAPSA
jgi:dTDP-4-dehydrorhamnose reductase